MTAFTLIASFEAKPGFEARLQTELSAMVEPSTAEPGCLGYRPYLDPSDPTRMIILEEWTSQASLDAHFQTPHFRHVAEVLDEILAVPFSLTRLVRTESGPARTEHEPEDH
ncbi:putative quinol monooxygenase [Brevibacterium renqingii]|uniref:putative quinol monooxygenase n=1 Tax=Brevibacterium renqingii TaxID=2776916 RepID=UPI001AE0384F|nr:putative quinol monooxygenase [Brevibacterium renqingii]